MERRFHISGTGLEVLLGLSQSPEGLRMAELAAVLAFPMSTVESQLQTLVRLGIVRREAHGPRYALRGEHEAGSELVALAERVTPPERAAEIVLRANPVVESAYRDDDGFIATLRDGSPHETARLDATLERIGSGRRDAPRVTRFDSGELSRLLRVVPSLRMRVAAAEPVKERAREPSSVPSVSA